MEKNSFPGMEGMDEYEPRLSLQAMEGPEHTKATMIRSADYKYVKRLYERDELFINLMGVRGAPIAWLKKEVLVKGRPMSEVLAAMLTRNGK